MVTVFVLSTGFFPKCSSTEELKAKNLGNCLELFLDRSNIGSMKNLQLRLNSPVRKEIAIKFDKPWEGIACAYVTVFKDDDRYRMYYRGWPDLKKPEFTCYAESQDGIHWKKPSLGLFDFNGSKENNIVWKKGYGSHNFTPFKDARAGVLKGERYKALGLAPKGTRGLVAFSSPDGIHWNRMHDEPVITKGAFDSQNLAFWDPNRKKYVAYFRIFTRGVRAIAWATSDDFIHWSETKPVSHGNSKPEHFYTNAITPYYRAPHYYFGFPKRFVPSRKRLPKHSVRGISDAVFIHSHDGINFPRTFREALIRPGRARDNWGDRSTMVAWGLVPTADDEMSIYFSQGYRFKTHRLQRGTFRVDGITSIHATADEGELTTGMIRFSGKHLKLNYATSAAGSVRVEILDESGKPIPGFTLKESKTLYGDEISEVYSWKSGNDVSILAGKPIKLRFVLKDCDLYSYRFSGN